MFLNQKGISMMQVLVASAMVAGLALVTMRLSKNIIQTQNISQGKADELELRSSIRMILNDSRYCRVSLAGNGPEGYPSSPVVFKKRDIDQDDEGLDISLYLSNQVGNTRTLKKFNGQNNPGAKDMSRFSKIMIKSMKLIMNNGVGANYSNAARHTDAGIVRVIVEKKINNNKTRDIKMDFDVNLTMSTGVAPETSGQTRIISCVSALPDINAPTNCAWEKYTYNNAYRAYRKCSNSSQRVISGSCSCGGPNCGGGPTPGILYKFEQLTLSVNECVCTDWTCSNCGDVRTACSGASCNAFSCSYTKPIGGLYLSIMCCD